MKQSIHHNQSFYVEEYLKPECHSVLYISKISGQYEDFLGNKGCGPSTDTRGI